MSPLRIPPLKLGRVRAAPCQEYERLPATGCHVKLLLRCHPGSPLLSCEEALSSQAPTSPSNYTNHVLPAYTEFKRERWVSSSSFSSPPRSKQQEDAGQRAALGQRLHLGAVRIDCSPTLFHEPQVADVPWTASPGHICSIPLRG
ncbi:hypothetical protein HispidOSU_021919 [Sigmodon hispidus]